MTDNAKVLVSDKLSEHGVKILRDAPGIEVDVKVGMTPEQLIDIIGSYDGLIIRSATKVTPEVLDAAKNLKVIGRAGIGVDNVDKETASAKGIIVMNTPGGNTTTTAEHAISMMMAMCRQIPQATASVRAGKWEKKKFMGMELYGKILGVVGIGRIGSIVVKRARGLEMRVIAYDPFISNDAADKLGVELVSLDELYARADVISVHTPMTKETKHMIGSEAFGKMKKGVKIVNCARGGIIDETALAEAVKEGKVAGAALDVFENEPPGD
ncbi:D-3-phosphoglycerate dehydrogenase, partial [hydrothermal vent metagenome]